MKTYKTITVVALLLLVASLIGNFFLLNNKEVFNEIKVSSAEEEYDAKYTNFDSQTKKVKMSIFDGALDAQTSPTEIKYLLLKMAPELTPAEKDKCIAKYINHIQYFASTYTNVALMYSTILDAFSEEIDFSTRDSAYQISDRVLRNLLLEIWDSDMILYLPGDVSQSPAVIVDYDGLQESYADFITDDTKEYLQLKTNIINGDVSAEDGKISYENLETFLDQSLSFIQNHPEFPILSDVKYMYVVAAKMYTDIYLVEEGDIEYNEEAITRLTTYMNNHDGTPLATVIKTILDDVAANGKLTSDKQLEVQASLSSLAD